MRNANRTHRPTAAKSSKTAPQRVKKTHLKVARDSSPDETAGLPYADIPRHLGVDTEDETTLIEGYSRAGAGDRNPERGEDELDAKESEGLRRTGV